MPDSFATTTAMAVVILGGWYGMALRCGWTKAAEFPESPLAHPRDRLRIWRVDLADVRDK